MLWNCEDLIPKDINVKKLIADKGYYSIVLLEKLSSQGIMPVIPPPPHAVVHGEEWSKWHDKIVQYIKLYNTYNCTQYLTFNTIKSSATSNNCRIGWSRIPGVFSVIYFLIYFDSKFSHKLGK